MKGHKPPRKRSAWDREYNRLWRLGQNRLWWRRAVEKTGAKFVRER